jgi:glycosyltransferase involved in cell wall biosynthesis
LELPSELRVVHVVDSLEIGGLERLVHDLAIARGGGSTSVACLVSLGPFGEALRQQGIQVELIGTKNGIVPTVWRMWRHLRRVRPDVVHCHNLFAHLTGSLGARLAGGIPVVMTKHGAMVPGTGLGSRLNRFLVRRADVVAVSREAISIMQAWMPTGSRPVRYIANGISLTPYENLPSREEARAQLGLPAGGFIVGIVARVTGLKGHVLLIEVFARLLEKFPGALLLIVGDGAGLVAVRARIQELGVEESMLVMGARSDVPKILAAMDVFCLPSEMEGMPMTVLEAMAAGLPVVTSNVGGIPAVVEAGRTGLMVPARAAEELEAALLALASDPGRARQMGGAGQQSLMREFSLERTIGAYEDLYREAMDRRGS